MPLHHQTSITCHVMCVWVVCRGQVTVPHPQASITPARSGSVTMHTTHQHPTTNTMDDMVTQHDFPQSGAGRVYTGGY